MLLLTFKTSGELRLGVKTEQGVIDVKLACQALETDHVPAMPAAFLADGSANLPILEAFVRKALRAAHGAPWLVADASLNLGPCIPSPGKILCVGLNYHRHAIESDMEPPGTPVLFSKFTNTVAASGEAVPLPPTAYQYDYEAELAVVIGKRTRNVSEEEALTYVLGYCNANDISARDLQMLTSQWLLGKTLDKFLPLGPYLVTASEVGDPQDLSIRCWLNGQMRQDSHTSDMIFSVAQIVSYASQYMTLESGDVISTGTPEGTILGTPDRIWMKPGDEIEVEIGNLGRLTNRMIREG